MEAKPSLWKRDILGWSLYDFANTIYSMNIVSLYLKRYVVEDLGYDDRYFDIPFSISMLLAALLLPALGALSDQSTKKKIFLFLFTVTCCLSVGAMTLVPDWAIGGFIALFIVANFSYEAGQPFYNSLLYSVASGRQARLVSGFGVALGYVGSVIGMILVLPFVEGEMYGFDIPFLEGGGKLAALLPTAILFLLFALPLFFWVKEAPVTKAQTGGMRKAYRDVWQGIRETKRYPGVLRFLVADYFIEDAVTTVILNIGLYCSLVLGLAEREITTFLIISTLTAVAGSFLIGFISSHISLKKIINLIIAGWVFALLLFVFTDEPAVIWLLGSVVGVLLGGLWTTTRPYLAELVPKDELGRFFGLFALSGRAAAFVGPLLWTLVVYLFNRERAAGAFVVEQMNLGDAAADHLPYKIGVLSLVGMLLIGWYLFRTVPDVQGDSHA